MHKIWCNFDLWWCYEWWWQDRKIFSTRILETGCSRFSCFTKRPLFWLFPAWRSTFSKSSCREIVNNGGFLHGYTYASNPLSCAIADAVLNELTNQKLIQNVSKIVNYLRNGLEKLTDNRNIIGDIRGLGLLIAIEIVANKNTKWMFGKELRAVYHLSEIGMEKRNSSLYAKNS